jgi:phytol kinase
MTLVIAAVAYLVLFVLIELATRKVKLHQELSRKLAHVLAGTSAAFLPVFMSFREIMILSLVFLPVMVISKRRNLFTSIHAVDRETYGEIFFPISIFLVAWWFPGTQIFTYGVLIMSISDGFASIIGQKYGKKQYRLWQSKKSYVGSIVFFGTALLIGLVVAPSVSVLNVCSLAAILTFTEAILSGGLDNLILPPLASALLLWIR